jgi:hypothetical protein
MQEQGGVHASKKGRRGTIRCPKARARNPPCVMDVCVSFRSGPQWRGPARCTARVLWNSWQAGVEADCSAKCRGAAAALATRRGRVQQRATYHAERGAPATSGRSGA